MTERQRQDLIRQRLCDGQRCAAEIFERGLQMIWQRVMNEGLQSRVEEAILEVADVDFFTGFGEGDDLQIARVGEVNQKFGDGFQ